VETQKVTPYLWFYGQAEEAAALYTSLIPNSRITGITRFPEGMPAEFGTAGAVMHVDFELDGQAFTALNGGPAFRFTEAVSFVINCEKQDEVDRLWDALIADGGEPSQCSWLKDKFGLSWQITPTRLMELMTDPDPARALRVTEAMLQMTKIDIAALERAAAG